MPRQIVRWNFGRGIDEHQHADLVEMPSLLTARNVQHDKSGTLAKRGGNLALPNAILGGGTLVSGRRLGTNKNEILLLDGTSIYSYAPSAAGLAYVGPTPEALPSRRAIAQVGSGIVGPYDVCASGTLNVVLSCVDQLAAQYVVTVFDAITGAEVLPPAKLPVTPLLNTIPRMVANAGRVFIFVAESSTGFLRAVTVDLTNPSVLLPFTVTTLIGSNDVAGGIDACLSSNANEAIVVYYQTGGPHSVKVLRVGVSGATPTAIASALSGANTGAGTSLAVCMAGTSVFVAFQSTATTISWGKWDANVTTSSFGTWFTDAAAIGVFQNMGIAMRDPSDAILTFNETISGGTAPGALVSIALGSLPGSPTAGPPLRLYNAVPASKPFNPGNGTVYVLARNVPFAGSDVQPSTFVLDVLDNYGGYFREVTRIAPRLAGLGTGGSVTSVLVGSPCSVLVPVKRNANAVGLELVTLDFGAPARWVNFEFGDATLFSGGVPSFYDGTRFAELGFALFPDTPSLTRNAAAGSFVAGTYQYVAIYRDVNGRGDVAYSAPSPVATVTPINNDSVSVKVPSLQVSSRRLAVPTRGDGTAGWQASSIYVDVYRTIAGGSTFFYIGTVRNDPTVGSVSFTDTGNITLGAPLYTQPGTQGTALPRMCPPAAVHMVQHNERVFLIAEDGSLWFSGVRVQGEEPWFSPLQQIPMARGAQATALASYMGRLFVFTSTRIYVIDGDGPPDNGFGGEFPPLQQVPSVHGCTEPRSLVEGPEGLWFKSEVGLCVLSRAMQVDVVLESEGTLATYPVVTSATRLGGALGRHAVRFTLEATENASGGAWLDWDWHDQTWATGQPLDADLGAGVVGSAQDAVMSGSGLWTWLTPTGRLYQERRNNGTDAGQFVQLAAETPWIKLAGLQGYQRIYTAMLLLESQSNHDLTVQVAYDFGAYGETHTFTWSQISALDRPQLEIPITAPECQAIKFFVQDATPTAPGTVGNGLGVRLVGIDLEVEALQGLSRRTPAARA